MKLTIHIGIEKTGSTSIQSALAADRARLAEAGILFPTLFGSANHMELAVAAAPFDPANELQIIELGRQACSHTDYRTRLKARIAEEVGAGDYSRIVVSNEHCHSRLTDPAAIARLIDLFPVDVQNCDVVVYLRRQDRLAVSLYSTVLRLGGASPVFPAFAANTPPYYFRFDRILENYAGVVGAENITLRLFDSANLLDRDVVRDFYRAADLGLDPSPVARENESISLAQAIFLSRFNERFPLLKDGKLNEDRQDIGKAISKAGDGAKYRPERDSARAFYDHFADGNDRVRQTFLPDLDRDTLFDEDFSDYPLVEPDWHLTDAQYFDFVEAIWRFGNRRVAFERAKLKKLNLAAR